MLQSLFSFFYTVWFFLQIFCILASTFDSNVTNQQAQAYCQENPPTTLASGGEKMWTLN